MKGYKLDRKEGVVLIFLELLIVKVNNLFFGFVIVLSYLYLI